MKTMRYLLVLGLAQLAATTASAVIDTSGTLYYTTFSGGANIHKVDYSWVGGLLTFSGNTAIGPGVTGADGILFLPNGNLAIGGQGLRVHEVTLAGSLVTTFVPQTDSYHLSLSPGGKVLYSASIPGGPTAITLNGSGGLVGATSIALPTTGANTVLDTIAWAPSGTSLYTSSGSGGGGVVGTITFAGGPEAPTSATTSLPVGPLDASHGMAYDPFSGNFITMGDDSISRFSSTGVLLETRTFAGVTDFDQGTVDGLGHIFAAENDGDLYLIDYSFDGTLAGATFKKEFLASALDDIAPKVGSGSIPTPDAGSSLLLLGLGVLGIRAAQRKLRA